MLEKDLKKYLYRFFVKKYKKYRDEKQFKKFLLKLSKWDFDERRKFYNHIKKTFNYSDELVEEEINKMCKNKLQLIEYNPKISSEEFLHKCLKMTAGTIYNNYILFESSKNLSGRISDIVDNIILEYINMTDLINIIPEELFEIDYKFSEPDRESSCSSYSNDIVSINLPMINIEDEIVEPDEIKLIKIKNM